METLLKQKMIIAAITMLLFSVNSTWSQEDISGLDGNNELKINALSTLAGFAEVSYDYILNDESSLGVSTSFSFDNRIDYDFMIIPNYKFFFGKKPAAGFFIEANAAIYSQEEQGSSFIGNFSAENGKSHIGFGAGIAIGGKFISTKNGFVGEIFIGGGRNFINNDKIDDGYPRVGISIGKRF